jgi:ketosteroid isomerase-like protein
MSHEAVVRALWEGWERGDFSVGADLFDPEIEFVLDSDLERVEVRGPEAMRRAWREHLKSWERWHAGPIAELIEFEDMVVAVSAVHGRGKHAPVEVTIGAAAVAFTFRQGKIKRLVVTDSRQKSLDAVGMPAPASRRRQP